LLLAALFWLTQIFHETRHFREGSNSAEKLCEADQSKDFELLRGNYQI
jgi:hypothetical protein